MVLMVVTSILSLQQQTFVVFQNKLRFRLLKPHFLLQPVLKISCLLMLQYGHFQIFAVIFSSAGYSFPGSELMVTSLYAFHMIDHSKNQLLKRVKVILSILFFSTDFRFKHKFLLSVVLFVSLASWQISLLSIQQGLFFLLSLKTNKLCSCCQYFNSFPLPCIWNDVLWNTRNLSFRIRSISLKKFLCIQQENFFLNKHNCLKSKTGKYKTSFFEHNIKTLNFIRINIYQGKSWENQCSKKAECFWSIFIHRRRG